MTPHWVPAIGALVLVALILIAVHERRLYRRVNGHHDVHADGGIKDEEPINEWDWPSAPPILLLREEDAAVRLLPQQAGQHGASSRWKRRRRSRRDAA